MNVPCFEIHARSDAICAQRLILALTPRGASYQWIHQRRGEQLIVRYPDGKIESCEDPLAMIELVESCFPDQPFHPRDGARLALHRRLMKATLEAERRLSDVLIAKGMGDLDLALHFLFRSLEHIEAGIEPPPRVSRQPLSNLDVMLAPLLWRFVVLDRRASTYILTSLPQLAARAGWLLNQIEVRELFDRQAADHFIAEIGPLGAGVAVDQCADWAVAKGADPAGPARREPSLAHPSPDRPKPVTASPISNSPVSAFPVSNFPVPALRGPHARDRSPSSNTSAGNVLPSNVLASNGSASNGLGANASQERQSPPLPQLYATRPNPGILRTTT